MSEPKARLAEDIKASLKAGERTRLAALRLLSASVKNREVELRREVTDEEFVEVATREVKRRREAIDAYEKADRADRAAIEAEEMEALQGYVPAGLSDDELDALIDRAMETTGAQGPADMGAVMRVVMGSAKGRADGRAVQEKVRGRLGRATPPTEG
jgi:uncharacterized protein